MRAGLALAGVLASLAVMLALIYKWKLPRRGAVPGAIAASLLAGIIFWWVYPTQPAPPSMAVLALSGQVALAMAGAGGVTAWRFLRDPERQPLEDVACILSPADGEVVYVREVPARETPLVTKHGRRFLLDELTGTTLVSEPCWVIGVEISYLDVHVNRCPVAGHVRQLRHIGGEFLSLRREEAPFLNERFTTVIENCDLTLAVVQVASRMVRRIDSYLQEGEYVSAAQRLGVIRLGSLVAVVLPMRPDVRVVSKVGDRVFAGLTVLARLDAERLEES